MSAHTGTVLIFRVSVIQTESDGRTWKSVFLRSLLPGVRREILHSSHLFHLSLLDPGCTALTYANGTSLIETSKGKITQGNFYCLTDAESSALSVFYNYAPLEILKTDFKENDLAIVSVAF